MNKILLVEDDQSFGYILSEYLQMQDFVVDWAKSGEEGLKLFANKSFDLGILDIMLPGINGFELATKIRKSNNEFPFIFLSAKSLKIDKLKGYKAGAEDYITKPVDEELLVAKIKALLKRTKKSPVYQEHYQIGNYQFDFQLQQLQLVGEVQKLTKREAELLQLFCENKDRLLSRKKALTEIWGSTDEFNRKSMDVFVSHLRKYLSKDPSIKIENVHGQGFIFSYK